MTSADYIIVGAGTAGCVLARRLLEQTDATILLLEAGPRYPAWALDPPLIGLRLRQAWSWPFRSVPQTHLHHRQIAFPMGRVNGGTSSVNAMLHVPSSAADRAAWESAGGPDWSPPALAAFAARAMGSPGSAPMPPSPPSFQSPFSEAFLEACREHGLHRSDPLSGDLPNHCGYFNLFQNHGRRLSTANTYLAPILHHPRRRLHQASHVLRILFQKDRATGVAVAQRRTLQTLTARRGVILCAGVFMSPHLLQHSGVGHAPDLAAHGIKALHHLPGVGQSLQDHLSIPLLYHSDRPSPGRPSRWLPALLHYLARRQGVVTSNCCEVGCFLAAPPSDLTPSLEVVTHFQTSRHPRAVELELLLLHPRSRGQVRLAPGSDPTSPPLIDPRYLSDPHDLQTLLHGIAQVRELAARPALRDFPLRREIWPGPTCQTPAALQAVVAAHASTAYHPVGTCRMGQDPLAVVNPQLQVHGLQSLWIADASVIPTVPTGHPVATILTIAEKAAAAIAS